MLRCPDLECQFENPSDHRFCQKCGKSLTQSECGACGAILDFDQDVCTCGVPSPHRFRALFLSQTTPPTVGDYLDQDGRYRLLHLEADGSSGVVLDENPFATTYLDWALRDQVSTIPASVPRETIPYLIADKSDDHGGLVPKLEDAWIQEGRSVVLLENRQDWLRLTDCLHQPDIDGVQGVQWLGEIARAWHYLTTQESGVVGSVLRAENWRMDAYGTMGLSQLYRDSDPGPSLGDLGGFLRDLLAEVGFYQNNARLQEWIQALAEGSTIHLEDFQNQLLVFLEQENAEVTGEGADLPEESWDDQTQPLFGDTHAEDRMVYSSGDEEQPTVVLPMQLRSLDQAALTDIGQQRDHNEDFFALTTEVRRSENPQGTVVEAKGLYVVCDGMGGHAAGEVASTMATHRLCEYFQNEEVWGREGLPNEDVLVQGILAANEALYQINLDNARSGSGRMGTTLVMALVHNNQVAIAHVGDSRVYRVSSKWGLEQLTVDHEVGQREIERGVDPEIAYGRPDAYQLTQALGPRNNDFVAPNVLYVDLQEDTILLLCSDGLSDNDLVETYWQDKLLPLLSSRANLDEGVNELIALANEHNGHDNITALVVRVKVRPNLDQPF